MNRKFLFKFYGNCRCSEYDEIVEVFIPNGTIPTEREQLIQDAYDLWIHNTFNTEIKEL